MRYPLGLSLLLLGLSACSQVQVAVPNPRVESPELRGERGLIITGGGIGTHVYKATENGSRRPPDMDDADIKGAEAIEGGVSYALGAPISLGLEFNGPNGQGGDFVAKLQLMGAGNHAADVGDIPISIYLRAGFNHGENSGNQNDNFGAGGYNWKGSVDATYIHVGASMGYRSSAHILPFWGFALGQYWVRSEVDQDPHSNPTDVGGSYVRGDNGFAFTGGAGLEFAWKKVQFFVNLEATSYDYKHTEAEFDPFVHGGVIVTP